MVYVDNMRAKYGRLIMCHMIADSPLELAKMCVRIGVDYKWIQKEGTHEEHFDICLSKRKMAIREGAIPVTLRELVQKIRSRGTCISPALV